MEKTKIDWAESTWNPVTGCNHDCPYCYARNIVRRFGGGKVLKYGNRAVLIDPVKVNGKILPYPYPRADDNCAFCREFRRKSKCFSKIISIMC